jgi:thiol-disulfide isomerase/thioredoxin
VIKRYWMAAAIGVTLATAMLTAGMGLRGSRSKATVAAGMAGHTATTATAAQAPQAPGNQAAVIRFVKNPEPAPPFLTHDLDGKLISSADLKGKVTLITFWATWCGPCRAEIPDLIHLETQYAGKLQVIGISVDEDPAASVKKFVDRAGINYPVIMANADIVRGYGGVPALPTIFVLNTNGGVVQKHVGLFPVQVYDREIRALLGMPVDATVQTFEDHGQVFLKNAANAEDLPGVSFAGLTAAQKKLALHRLNAESCNCGCGLTMAQCRINDTTCPVSQKLARDIIESIRQGKSKPAPESKPAAETVPSAAN